GAAASPLTTSGKLITGTALNAVQQGASSLGVQRFTRWQNERASNKELQSATKTTPTRPPGVKYKSSHAQEVRRKRQDAVTPARSDAYDQGVPNPDDLD